MTRLSCTRPVHWGLTKLPWIPSEQQWLGILQVARQEPVRNWVMLALAYDAALRAHPLLAGCQADPSYLAWLA